MQPRVASNRLIVASAPLNFPIALTMPTNCYHATFLFASVSLLTALLVLSETAASSTPQTHQPPAQEETPQVLSLAELQPLETISKRVASMMSVISTVPTRIWPHGVRDHQGRQGIFLSSQRPLFNDSDPAVVQAKQAWVVYGLIASVKYSEGSQVGHIAFTDRNGETGERWYYDLCMTKAREIHSLLISGLVRPQNAYRLIEGAWQKVTSEHAYAVN